MTRPITREQFELVRPLLEGSRKKTRPRKHDLYDVLCAILQRDRDGLTWRTLPAEYTLPWRTVHDYHAQWTMPAKIGGPVLLDQVMEVLVQGGAL